MAGLPKTSWADDVDELEQPKLRKPEETIDANGIITTIEFSVNEEGRPIKITKRIRRTLQKQIVQHAVAERKNWAKFGQEKGNKAGPDRSTTTVGENVALKLSAGNKYQDQEPTEEDQLKSKLAKAGAGNIQCRQCKGPHFTSRCPYKGMLGGLDEASGLDTPPFEEEAPAPTAAAPGGKYVPPSMRAGGTRAGEAMGRPGAGRDGLPTVRISNLSKDAMDSDVRDLIARAMLPRPSRVHIVSDHMTKLSKGFAFVSFEERTSAEQCIVALNGRGYDNLILNVSWTEPREPRENRM